MNDSIPTTPTAAAVKPADDTTCYPALTQAPAPVEPPQLRESRFTVFSSMKNFKDAKRMARMLVRSTIVPGNYRGDEHLGDCVIALEIANRLGASILAVMQNLQLVEGKPGWSSQFLISCVNASGKFSPIRFEMTGTRGEDSWGCIASAIDRTGQVLKSPEVTIAMAKLEGWYYRPGSKWQTMPGLMLCYRSATLFTRLYAPEITMGIQTTEEVVDVGLGNGKPSRPVFESVPAKPKVAVKSRNAVQEKIPINRRALTTTIVQKPGPTSAPEPATHIAGGFSSDVVAPQQLTVATAPGHYNHLRALTGLIRLSKHAEAEVLAFLRNTRRCDENVASLIEVANTAPDAITWTHDNWKAVDQELTHRKNGKAS